MVKSLAVRDALNMALDEELARDDKVLKEKHLFAEKNSQFMDSHLMSEKSHSILSRCSSWVRKLHNTTEPTR